MARSYFDNELDLLHSDLIKMGSMIEAAIEKSIQAMDPQHRHLAREISAEDKLVDEMERAIQARCLRLMLRQQPVAKDLRAISTAIKMVTDMERIGDQAADIADIVLRFNGSGIGSMAQHIPQMAQIATEMVTGSIDAFVKKDLDLAQKIIAMDDQVDALFDVVKHELIATLKQPESNIDQALDTMMIAKYLERIGDHAENICEWVEFYQTGIHKSSKLL